MADDFRIFKKFPSAQMAQETAQLLNDAGIQTIVADDAPPVDVTFSGGGSQQQLTEIRIAQEDFDKAQAVLQKQAEKLIDEIDPGYYLFEFSDEELYEILAKPDEWGEVDYALSAQILRRRGKSVEQEDLVNLVRERIKTLAEPEKKQTGWIIFGYITAFVGGFLGLIIGYSLWKSKTTLPNGAKVHSYLEKDRNHGKTIFIIGVIVAPVLIAIQVFGGLF